MMQTPDSDRCERPLLILGAGAPRGDRARVRLIAAAERLGIEVAVLRGAEDLRSVELAVTDAGADALAVCAQPPLQALAAAVATGRNLPFSCVPADCCDLLARDLGSPLEDPVEALALVFSSAERMIDLAEVNGLTFVNYVAIGFDPRAPAGGGLMRARDCGGLAPMLVANNRFASGPEGLGPRSWPDTGLLSVAFLRDAPEPARSGSAAARHLLHAAAPGSAGGGWQECACARLELTPTGTVEAVVDDVRRGLRGPLRFRCVPRALRVRISGDAGSAAAGRAPRSSARGRAAGGRKARAGPARRPAPALSPEASAPPSIRLG